MSDKPVKKFQIGFVETAIWKNGDNDFFNVTIQKKYKVGDEIRHTNSLSHSDLLNVARLLYKCENWITEQ